MCDLLCSCSTVPCRSLIEVVPMLWKWHAQSRLLGISAQRCVLRSGITGQELLLASCSVKLLPVSCSTWCCFTLCRVIKGVRSGIRGYVCVAKARTNQRCNIVPHKCRQLFVTSRINAASERCVHFSSGLAIIQTFVERGVYLRQLGVTAPSSVNFASSQGMGDVEVSLMQGLVSNSCSLCFGVKVCKEGQQLVWEHVNAPTVAGSNTPR